MAMNVGWLGGFHGWNGPEFVAFRCLVIGWLEDWVDRSADLALVGGIVYVSLVLSEGTE